MIGPGWYPIREVGPEAPTEYRAELIFWLQDQGVTHQRAHDTYRLETDGTTTVVHSYARRAGKVHLDVDGEPAAMPVLTIAAPFPEPDERSLRDD